jgi:hypothetical protein
MVERHFVGVNISLGKQRARRNSEVAFRISELKRAKGKVKPEDR